MDKKHRGLRERTAAMITHFERETGLPLMFGVGVGVDEPNTFATPRRCGNRVC